MNSFAELGDNDRQFRIITLNKLKGGEKKKKKNIFKTANCQL